MIYFTKVLFILSSIICRTSGGHCTLKETSRYPWVVQIWNTSSSRIVGHGALLSADRVLSSCNAFVNVIADLGEEKYEMIVHHNRGAGRHNPPCTESRFANSILIHPECKTSDEIQIHDFAMWNLERPFDVSGNPFLTPSLPEKYTIIAKLNKIGLNEYCRIIVAENPDKKEASGREKLVGRCGFKNPGTLEVCEGESCQQQAADGLLCFYDRAVSADSWKVRNPSETPDFIEGSVVVCYGTPVGIASRAFYRNGYQVYRMFSNFVNNMGFLNITWTPVTPTTTSVTSKTSSGTSTSHSTSDNSAVSGRTWTDYEISTPINCTCLDGIPRFQLYNGQTAVREDQIFYYLSDYLVIYHALQLFMNLKGH